MKQSIIKDIYFGKCGHCETITESEEYWSLINEASELSEALEKSLKGVQKEILKKLSFLEAGIESQAALSSFKEGFKIGLLIGIETCRD